METRFRRPHLTERTEHRVCVRIVKFQLEVVNPMTTPFFLEALSLLISGQIQATHFIALNLRRLRRGITQQTKDGG